MRLFLAIFPPPETQSFAHDVIAALKRPADSVSWVKRENLHFTMRFLGEVDEGALARITDAAREAAAQAPAFDAQLGRCGAFPGLKRARVLWLGLEEGAAPMTVVAGALERALEKRGFEPDRNKFSPHLTIGRVREPRHDWTSPLAAVGTLAQAQASRFSVRSLQIMQSQLQPAGSIYSVLEDVPLAR
jgi:2'-5' RNA ligase